MAASCCQTWPDFSESQFGTYFIGYARTPAVTEKMLENMFLGDPPGNYDRILDFSTPVTGTLFFAPAAGFLDDLPDPPRPATNGPGRARQDHQRTPEIALRPLLDELYQHRGRMELIRNQD